MLHQINLTKSVLTQLKKIPDNTYLKIREGFNMLEHNPRPVGCKKLTNEEGYRIRVGRYRILYIIDDKNFTVKIYKLLTGKMHTDKKYYESEI